MSRIKLLQIFYLLLVLHFCLIGSAKSNDKLQGIAIATVDPIATDAALQAMIDGGNAFDASVAAALTLGVVNG